MGQYQPEVASIVQGFVSKAVDGCSLADQLFEDANTGTLFDAIPSSQVIPWAGVSLSPEKYAAAFDEYKYPAGMPAFAFKTTWRELLHTPQCTLKTLLELPFEWHRIGFPQSMENLRELLECYLSYNLGGTTLYIGNNLSQQGIDRAVNIADNLLQAAVGTGNVHHK